eukprot:CAMPEP_0198679782 /NCGR_PEP_ID=MMETSP1468-20131203/3349_1 /TAXON_ID=1461545 /ORGANISM="Mantoniella sp, Strain CCMP1436" /LENGTH=116 /DNA_ID=CAMNT_0044418925 /DNA_START=997 /DNA_END=1347 /DNA_ORIENTATION=+
MASRMPGSMLCSEPFSEDGVTCALRLGAPRHRGATRSSEHRVGASTGLEPRDIRPAQPIYRGTDRVRVRGLHCTDVAATKETPPSPSRIATNCAARGRFAGTLSSGFRVGSVGLRV